MSTSRGHVPPVDFLGALGILFILGALIMMTARCRPIVPPAPPPDVDAGPPIEPTQPGDCSRACARLRELRCPWADDTPGDDGQLGTADDGICEGVCEAAERAPETSLNPRCVVAANSCEEADACTR